MGLLWSICFKDTSESVGPAQSQRRAQKKRPPTPSGPPSTWGPPRGPHTPKDKRPRKSLVDGEGPAASYSSMNGTGPPAKFTGSPVGDRAKEKEKATSWAKPPPMYAQKNEDYSPVTPSPPQSPRDSPKTTSFKRSFSLRISGKQSPDPHRPIKSSLRRTKKK